MMRCPFPWDMFFSLASDLPSGRRSLLDDARDLARRIEPPPIVEGAMHVPPGGAVVLVPNHYQRRGLWIGWPGVVITVAVADRRLPQPEEPVHWLATSGVRLFQWAGRGPEVPVTRRLFGRVAELYGMTPLPIAGSAGRARAIRRWLRWLEAGQVIGVFPEGLAGRTALRPPEPGFGALLRMMSRYNPAIVPVGIFERGDTLHIRFGEVLPDAADGDEVMLAIARLLPDSLRGAYAGAV